MEVLKELLQLKKELEAEIKSIKKFKDRNNINEFTKNLHEENLRKLRKYLFNINNKIEKEKRRDK